MQGHPQTCYPENEVHKRIKFLTKRHQGKVMGVLRDLGMLYNPRDPEQTPTMTGDQWVTGMKLLVCQLVDAAKTGSDDVVIQSLAQIDEHLTKTCSPNITNHRSGTEPDRH